MRPKGFKNSYARNPEPTVLNPEYRAFEAGADAYEEGLKKQSEEGDYVYFTGEFLLPSNFLSDKGYLVFIPED